MLFIYDHSNGFRDAQVVVLSLGLVYTETLEFDRCFGPSIKPFLAIPLIVD